LQSNIEENELPHPLMNKQWKLLGELISKTGWDTYDSIRETAFELQKVNNEISTKLKEHRDKRIDKPNVMCRDDDCTYHDKERYCAAWQVINIDENGKCISKRITEEDK